MKLKGKILVVKNDANTLVLVWNFSQKWFIKAITSE